MAHFEETDLRQEEDSEEEASYDEQHALVAQSIEVNKLRQQVDLLKRANERIKDQYRQEIRTLLQPLIGKHKTLQEENDRLKRRLEEMSQVMPGEGLGTDLESIGEEMAKLRYDNGVLQKVVDALENEVRQLRREAAEVGELRNVLKGQGTETVQAQRELEAVRQLLRQTEAQSEDHQRQEETLQATVTQLQRALADLEGQHQEVLAGYQRQLGEAQHRIGTLQQQLNEWQGRAQDAEEGLKEELSSTDELVGILAEARRLLEPEGPAPAEVDASVEPSVADVFPPSEETGDPVWLPPETAEADERDREASDELDSLVELLTASQGQILDDEEEETSA